ncbi:hypothetical protein E2C01_011188 [Portunus trituberculatus]|uniref:Uncharacterized protein n=1 Tax=Portunus trituberculatus TaxID=210409 RepID=A0A5B7DAS3_PORTR|nr:hypothetical protein [Portunus trituberculatus]
MGGGKGGRVGGAAQPRGKHCCRYLEQGMRGRSPSTQHLPVPTLISPILTPHTPLHTQLSSLSPSAHSWPTPSLHPPRTCPSSPIVHAPVNVPFT